MNKKPNLAIVGATGVVGRTFLKVLEERNFPFENLYIMASAKSAGTTVTFKGKDYVVEELTENSFDKPIDIALFSAGGCRRCGQQQRMENEQGSSPRGSGGQSRRYQVEQGHHRKSELLNDPGGSSPEAAS